MSDSSQPVLNVPPGVQTPAPPMAPPTASGTPAGTLGPLAPERPEKTPRRGSARGIPAAPTALAALNATAVAGAGVSHAFGPMGGMAAGALALLAAGAVGTGQARSVARKTARAAAVQAARQTGSALGPIRSRSNRAASGGGLGSPSRRSGSSGTFGGTGSGSSNRRSGPTSTSAPTGSGGRHRKNKVGPTSSASGSGSTPSGSGAVRPGSGVRPGSTRAGSAPIGARSTGPAAGSRVRSGSGRPGSSGSGGSTSPPKSRSSRITRAGGGGSGSSSLARRAARGLIKRSDGTRRQPIQATKNAARAIKAAGQKVGRGSKKVWNSRPGKATRKAAVWSGRQGWRVARTLGAGVWAAIGRKGWREILRKMKSAWDRKKETGDDVPTPGIPGSKVTMPTTLVGGAATGTRPAATTGGGISMAQARFNEAAAEMFGAAMVYNPEGMMQVGQDFAQLPEAFRNIAGAMQTMAKRAHDNDPMHDAIIDIMYNIYQKLHEAAKLSEDLAPAFRSLHAVDIKRIESPRRGEEKWDLSANRDHAGRSV